MAIDIFQSLKNCVFDLQRADVQNYQQPLKQLARLLNSENLQSVNAHLTRNVEPRQPGGCKLKTAPVRPVVAARPAE
ncbi:hypothetical protein AB0Y15_25485, partial [Escherichia coli]